ncbi:hypothetical protein, partial [Tritonibacter sp. SIMBA_163]|uniref:hypothetical protein n=1 Tax=Tritonibacter sp. SIMBA_163 TaxID=3080868 RepID=UPI00397F6CA3
IELKEQLSQLQEEVNQRNEGAINQLSNEEIEQLQNRIQDLTENVNLLNQRQREENDYSQKVTEQFKTEIETIYQLVQEHQQQQAEVTNE